MHDHIYIKTNTWQIYAFPYANVLFANATGSERKGGHRGDQPSLALGRGMHLLVGVVAERVHPGLLYIKKIVIWVVSFMSPNVILTDISNYYPLVGKSWHRRS